MRETRSQGLPPALISALAVTHDRSLPSLGMSDRCGAALWKSLTLPCDVNESHQVSVDAAIRDKEMLGIFSPAKENHLG